MVCPGMIDTPMHRRGRELAGDAIYDSIVSRRIHSRRVGCPKEVASSILFLCSDEASYITATTLTPDGGFSHTL